ncbi:MAG: hypothetical protein RLZZ502_614 [Pseudomonadota bacterium]|jgi:sugar transferase (PEP-CTERM/EpsH1 system associated)
MKEPLLFICHRIPYPPNKGDKLLAWQMLKHLSADFDIYLAGFVDDRKDWAHVEFLREVCAEVKMLGIRPGLRKLKSLLALLECEAQTTMFYRSKSLQTWIKQKVAERQIKKGLAFSSGVAPFLMQAKLDLRIMSLVDLDSHKWALYAQESKAPMRWLYRREARYLFAYEQHLASHCHATTLVTDLEAMPLRLACPMADIRTVNNGVDTLYFSPENAGANPYPEQHPVLAFTGAMDYWPNIDAVLHFAHSVWPSIKSLCPQALFYVVGSKPADSLKALHGHNGICVTGFVADVRPYIAYAQAIVATLRIARGVQNKVLEAMAMGKWVLINKTTAKGVPAQDQQDYLLCPDEQKLIAEATRLLQQPRQFNQAARTYIEKHHSWSFNLRTYNELLCTPQ